MKGSDNRPIRVADFTTNHAGNFNLLLAMVDAAADMGCDYVKMQAKDVDSFYPAEKLNAPFASPYGRTFGQYRRIFEFGREDFRRFDAHCRMRGVKWFATVQDLYSLGLMLEFDLDFYKVASCNARNHDLLRAIAARVPTMKRIVMSVAGSSLTEIEASLACFPDHELYLLHCVAEYPCPPERVRLGNLGVLRQRFGSNRVKIGYSGHEVGFGAALAAVDLGAEMVEKHFCLSRETFVHHIECALNPQEFLEMSTRMRAEQSLATYYEDLLPAAAFRTAFGMSDKETAFLTGQTYGSVERVDSPRPVRRVVEPDPVVDLASLIAAQRLSESAIQRLM